MGRVVDFLAACPSHLHASSTLYRSSGHRSRLRSLDASLRPDRYQNVEHEVRFHIAHRHILRGRVCLEKRKLEPTLPSDEDPLPRRVESQRSAVIRATVSAASGASAFLGNGYTELTLISQSTYVSVPSASFGP
jgi:hypothetical protein